MLHRDWLFLRACRSSCTSKSAYSTRASAVTYLNHSGFKGDAYHCPICGDWHVTTLSRQEAKRINRRLRRILNDDQKTRAAARPVQ